MRRPHRILHHGQRLQIRGTSRCVRNVLTCSGGVQIFQGGANHTSRESPDDFDFTAFQELEKPFGVLLFLIGGLFKDVGDLNQPILAGLAGKIGIAVTCLGFSGK
jgi:hypothetical protein